MHSLDFYTTVVLVALAARLGWALGTPLILVYHTLVNYLPYKIARYFWVD